MTSTTYTLPNTSTDRLIYHGPNKRVVNMHHSLMDVLAKLGQKSALSISIYFIFVRRMDENNSLMMSRDAIAHILGVSHAGVSKATKLLLECGLIGITKNNGCNVYHIVGNPPIDKIMEQLQ